MQVRHWGKGVLYFLEVSKGRSLHCSPSQYFSNTKDVGGEKRRCLTLCKRRESMVHLGMGSVRPLSCYRCPRDLFSSSQLSFMFLTILGGCKGCVGEKVGGMGWGACEGSG